MRRCDSEFKRYYNLKYKEDLADAGNRGQGVWNDSKYLFNLFIKNLDLLFQRPHGGNANSHSLVDRIVHDP